MAEIWKELCDLVTLSSKLSFTINHAGPRLDPAIISSQLATPGHRASPLVSLPFPVKTAFHCLLTERKVYMQKLSHIVFSSIIHTLTSSFFTHPTIMQATHSRFSRSFRGRKWLAIKWPFLVDVCLCGKRLNANG